MLANEDVDSASARASVVVIYHFFRVYLSLGFIDVGEDSPFVGPESHDLLLCPLQPLSSFFEFLFFVCLFLLELTLVQNHEIIAIEKLSYSELKEFLLFTEVVFFC